MSSTYLCRWPNGDFSIVTGANRLVIDEVLDEVGDPGCVEMVRLKHAVAVHFKLKETVDRPEVMNDCFEFEQLDERSVYDLFDAYPHLDDALDDTAEGGITTEKVLGAMEMERHHIMIEKEISDDPELAELQNMAGISKRMAENYKKIAEELTADEQE